MLEVKGIKGPTIRLLKEMLTEKGLMKGVVRARVNWGYGGSTSLPALNYRAGTINKLEELQLLAKNGVSTVPFRIREHGLFDGKVTLGRKVHHTRGTDIVFNPNRFVHCDFFTQLIPKRAEFRVWAFRGVPIGTYEKILTRPKEYGGRGRSKEIWNYRNGFSYTFIHPEDSPKELKALGCEAVKALGLDFGAVDILQGTDKKYYVLEVNTAPGVEGRRQGISSLVNHIEKWANSGFNQQEEKTSATNNRRTDIPRTLRRPASRTYRDYQSAY